MITRQSPEESKSQDIPSKSPSYIFIPLTSLVTLFFNPLYHEFQRIQYHANKHGGGMWELKRSVMEIKYYWRNRWKQVVELSGWKDFCWYVSSDDRLIGLWYLSSVFFYFYLRIVSVWHGAASKQAHLMIPLLQLLCHILKMYHRFNLKIFIKSDNRLQEYKLMTWAYYATRHLIYGDKMGSRSNDK